MRREWVYLWTASTLLALGVVQVLYLLMGFLHHHLVTILVCLLTGAVLMGLGVRVFDRYWALVAQTLDDAQRRRLEDVFE